MGASKHCGKIHTLKCFSLDRLGSVLDPVVVQLFNRQIANGGPVTITHPESVRYFMNTKEACH
jgi:FlaA1/EpsC-like NDP-sugar epimerase